MLCLTRDTGLLTSSTAKTRKDAVDSKPQLSRLESLMHELNFYLLQICWHISTLWTMAPKVRGM